jgi:putative ABC transport system ATP-binding protein
MIKTEAIIKIFRTQEVETTALNRVDLHIREGEFVAIMGPSGSGKSTLLNILGLLDSPSQGRYSFDGEQTDSLSERGRTYLRRGNIGFIFQSFNLIDELNVFENVEVPLNFLNIPRRERKERVETILDRMKMGHRKRHFASQLSGGQQQRVAIARAVVARPKLLLADEPTGNLDSKTGLAVMNLLSELNREGTTVVMVTHSLRASKFAHRVVTLLDGGIEKKKELTKQQNTILV